jgi:gliding motility-associated-like protein
MKIIPTTFCTLFYILSSDALPAQCTNGTQPECACETAPILCSIDELDGYTFSMTSFQHPDDGPTPICPGADLSQSNNPTWFAFTAWCTNLTLRVSADNCVQVQGYIGFQLAIYADCNFTDAVACNAEIDDCDDDDKILNITGLDIGAVYYFIVDGCLGSYCDVSIDVIGTCGQEEIAPWTTPLTGNTTPCEGEMITYEAENLTGAGDYHWYIDGNPVGVTTDHSFTITWPEAGTYELCVDASNDPCVPVTNAPAPQCTVITVTAAEAGSIMVEPSNACITGTVEITITGFNDGPDNAQVILIVDALGTILEVIPGSSGSFIPGLAGIYSIYSYNYSDSNSSLPIIGSHIQAIDCTSSCCDLEGTIITVQSITALAYAVECNDNGTGDDPGDDNFYFTLLVTGDGPGVSWTSTDGSITGWYGQEQIVGPFLISAGDPGLILFDNEASGCFANVIVAPPMPCSSCVQSADAGDGFVLNCIDSIAVLIATASEVADFQWTGPGSFIGVGPTVAVMDSGWYYLTAIFSNSCALTDSVFVGMDREAPLANADIDKSLDCLGNDVLLDGSMSAGNDLDYLWTYPNGTTIINQLVISTNQPGVHVLQVVSAFNGCSAVDSVEVFANPDAISSILADVLDESCIELNDGEIIVTEVNGGTPPFQFSINELNTNDHGTFSSLSPGAYQLHITDGHGCVIDTAFLVNNGVDLMLTVPHVIELEEGEAGLILATVNVPAQQLSNVQWIPPGILTCDTCLSTTLPIAANQHFQLVATHENGCMTTADLDIIVVPKPHIFIPTAFSPNSDGINDWFTVYANDRVEKITRMDIFDRWGDHVFHRYDFGPNDGDAGWDGTFHGQLLHPGAFVYVIELLMRNGTLQLLKGDVTIIR